MGRKRQRLKFFFLTWVRALHLGIISVSDDDSDTSCLMSVSIDVLIFLSKPLKNPPREMIEIP